MEPRTTHARKEYEVGALDEAAWTHLVGHSLRHRAEGGYAFHYDPAIGASFRGRRFDRDVDLSTIWEAVDVPVLLLRSPQGEQVLPRVPPRLMGESLRVWLQKHGFSGQDA